jgi:hypothetical protein
MSSKTVRRSGAVFLAVLTLFALAPRAALAAPGNAAPATSAPLSVPVTGTFALVNGGSLPFNGFFNVQQFANQNGQLVAIGTLTDVAGAAGGLPLTLPVTQATGSCQILDLTLGPLDLNLLGLTVHLDTVHLNITAQQGPGNLLGNLLCAVANLLNGAGGGGGLTTALANLLNQILAAL